MSPTMSDARPRIKVWQPWFDTARDEDELRRRAARDDWVKSGESARGVSVGQRGYGDEIKSASLSGRHGQFSLARESVNTPHGSRSQHGECSSEEGPLDMSVGRRSAPPPYDSSVSGPTCSPRSQHSPLPRPQSGTSTPKVPPDFVSVSDPAIDEHFRRSLGRQYHAVFNTTSEASSSPPTQSQLACGSSGRPPPADDTSGTSVDDHFAKALGDAWLQLKDNCSEKKVSNGLQVAR